MMTMTTTPKVSPPLKRVKPAEPGSPQFYFTIVHPRSIPAELKAAWREREAARKALLALVAKLTKAKTDHGSHTVRHFAFKLRKTAKPFRSIESPIHILREINVR